MKRTIKLALLACLILLVFTLTLTACDITDFIPSPNGTTTEVTTPKETTAPEETTTPKEITAPEETTPEPHVHTVAIDAAVVPTCTASGLTEGKHCATCFEVLVERKSVPALGHTEITNIAIAPTCTTDGKTEGKYCSVCGEILAKQEIVKALGHTEVVDQAVAPTCTATGLTEGKHCSDCNNVLVAQKVLRPNGHSFGEWYTIKESTETEKGEKRRDCGSCDGFETSPIAELAHNHNNWDVIVLEAVAPNCTETGLTEGKQCSGCNEILAAQTIVPALGHELGEWETSVPPHCYFYGWDYANCTRCDTYSEWREIEPTGHTEVIDNAVAPTCTKTGLTEGKHCSACGETLVAQTIVYALGHSFGEWTQTLAPTCTEKGGERRDCSVCEYFETREISANGHTNNEAVIENKIDATCTMHGSYDSVVYCSVCNSEVSRNIQIIRHLGHNYISIVIPPTVTTAGYTTHTCSACGDTYTDNHVPATGSIGLSYVVNEDGTSCTITGIGTCTDTEICISATIDGYTVTAIGDKAFAENAAITKIILPDTITTIGRRAFYKCTEITEFTVPESVTSIGTQIFFGCDKLTTVYYNGQYGNSENPFLSVKNLETVVFGGTKIPNYVAYNLLTLKTVIVLDSVTNIGISAFDECSNLTSVTIGNNVTSISQSAFSNCSSLTNVTIPDSVTSIASYAFHSCNALTDITLGNNLTNIGESVFWGCSSLTSITIPNSMTTIGTEVFRNCSGLTSITIPNSVTSIGSYAFRDCTNLTSITIPDSVTSIGHSAFSGCNNLENITLPFIGDSVKTESDTYHYPLGYIFGTSSYEGGVATEQYYYVYAPDYRTFSTYYIPASLKSVTITGGNIVYGAFYNCSNLTSIIISDSATSIGTFAFYNCSSLTNITIPNSVTSIGGAAFEGCSSITSITISDSVTSIGSAAFEGCSNLTSITIPNSITSIGGSTFQNCYSLTNITIPNSVTSIGGGAFYGCSSLTSITIPDSVTSIGSSTFYGCNSLTSINIPDGITKIDLETFYGCSNLTSITIPDSVTKISQRAFLNCTNLTSITIPDSVSSIERNVFYGCSSLTSITIPDSIINIESWAFGNCTALTSIVLPDSVTSIGDYAFYYCSNLISITISDSVTSIGDNAFGSCSSLTNIDVSCDNKYYKSIDGNLYSKDGTTFIKYAVSKTDTSFVIPDGVTSIGYEAFKTCNNLESITMPNSVTNISNNAFYGCSSLTEVTLGTSLQKIGEWAFCGCTNLTSLTIPSNVTSIGDCAFLDCIKLIEVINHSSLTIIAGETSNGGVAYNAKEVHIGTSKIVNQNNYLFYICSGGNYLFGYIGEDTDLVLPNSYNGETYEIYNYAFHECSNLTSITLSGSVTSIGAYAFYGCSNITSIMLPGSVTSIGEEAFSYCSGLTSITISNGVTTIGSRAFSFCSSLTSITIPDSITSIEGGAFSGCYRLVEVYDLSPSIWISKGSYGNGYVGYYALNIYTSANEPSKIWTDTEGYVFYEDGASCYLIGYIGSEIDLMLPATCNGKSYAINKYAFYDCDTLESINIPNNVTSIGQYAFYSCGNLASITVPDSVTSISVCAFGDCSSLTYVTIGKNVTSISEYAFRYSNALTNIDISVDNAYYKSVDGNLYSKDGTTLIKYAAGKTDAAFAIPNGVKSISTDAFYGCNNLTDITIPDSMTSINESAFENCYSLVNITIPDSVWNIGNYAFRWCNNLTSITIPSNVWGIGDEAFYNCYNLTSIIFEGYIWDWNHNISFGANWNTNSAIYEVICIDGTITLY